ncbi:hypothetical protein A6A06_19345 [Streptomyces sp. CB02923]|nr:hypothetical protein A6A06_19345 [Streptomyces sp. CB02923]
MRTVHTTRTTGPRTTRTTGPRTTRTTGPRTTRITGPRAVRVSRARLPASAAAGRKAAARHSVQPGLRQDADVGPVVTGTGVRKPGEYAGRGTR